jgi:hypothetical protein
VCVAEYFIKAKSEVFYRGVFLLQYVVLSVHDLVVGEVSPSV